MKSFIKLFAAVGLVLGTLGFAGHAVAEEAPEALVKRVSQEVIEAARSDQAIQSGDRKRIYALVESKIIPYIDFRRATALTVGRYWREATPAQQQQLIDEFRRLLLYSYAGAMSQVRDQKLEFQPLRADPADTEVEVHFQVRQPGRPEPIQVSYRLYKSSTGWKIYDVSVLGAWLSQTYRNSFSAEINKGGIDGLINTLSEKNKQLAAKSGGATTSR